MNHIDQTARSSLVWYNRIRAFRTDCCKKHSLRPPMPMTECQCFQTIHEGLGASAIRIARDPWQCNHCRSSTIRELQTRYLRRRNELHHTHRKMPKRHGITKRQDRTLAVSVDYSDESGRTIRACPVQNCGRNWWQQATDPRIVSMCLGSGAFYEPNA